MLDKSSLMLERQRLLDKIQEIHSKIQAIDVLVGDEKTVRSKSTRTKINGLAEMVKSILDTADGPLKIARIASRAQKQLNLDHDILPSIRGVLSRLDKAGEIERVSKGIYRGKSK